ncbi:tetratricopeptide repeat protein [Streptomyces sp. NPDC004237]|uniref:tetratricopeptide repeat protein n=1 Tax=Streptomyces sp. NPDC004237 TaxID=3154455 RepID=UPI0033A0533E
MPAAFTDRQSDLDSLTARIGELPEYAVRIVVISGPGGIGKTTLANRMLHLLAEQHPGGQFYADLRGYAPTSPASVGEVLSRFLRSLSPQVQPASLEELSACWRSATSVERNRPVSVLLDNARDVGQVRALLPGGAGHLVVVTSRGPLAELAPDGAVLHPLEPFDDQAALQYVERCLGEQRVAQDRRAVAQLLRRAAGSPMAIALTVSRLAADPARPLADVAVRAVDEHPADLAPSLHLLQETAVARALDQAYWSLRRDSPAPAVYRRMALTPTVDFDVPLTAAVCRLSGLQAADVLDQLYVLNLIELVTEDPSRGKVYRFHDLARQHGRGRAAVEATSGEAEETLRRGVDFYLATATAAERRLTPTHRRLRRDILHLPNEPVVFADDASALAWLTAQRHNLLPVIRAASAGGLVQSTWQLGHAIWPLLRASHDIELWSESHTLALEAAWRCGDRLAEIEILNTWGVGLRAAHRFEEAAETFGAVLNLARDIGDRRAEAQALHELGSAALHAGHLAEAESLLLQARELRSDLARRGTSEIDRNDFRRAVAITDICLGQVYIELGHPTKAIVTLTGARHTLTQIQDRLDAARALAHLARAFATAGNLVRAEEYGRGAVAECDEAGSPRWRAHSRELLARSAQAGHDTDRARSLYQEALAMYRDISSPLDEERVRTCLEDLA